MATRVPKALPPLFWPLGEGSEPPTPPPATAIGHDGGGWIYVDDQRAVFVSRPAHDTPRLVNSADTAFVSFMGVFAHEWPQRAAMSDDEADEQTRRLRQTLLRLDPDALTDPDAWWALILEQMHDGFL